MQTFGYDGIWFDTVDDALNNAYQDFKKPIKNTRSMSIIWGNNEFVKKLSKPKWGDDLITIVRNCLTEEGLINGN